MLSHPAEDHSSLFECGLLNLVARRASWRGVMLPPMVGCFPGRNALETDHISTRQLAQAR